MSYTMKNLTETADSAVKFGFSEMGEAHFAREELDAERTGISYQVLKPGKRQAFGHRHDKAEEVYVVLSGSGRVRLDDEISRDRAPGRDSRGAAASRARSRPAATAWSTWRSARITTRTANWTTSSGRTERRRAHGPPAVHARLPLQPAASARCVSAARAAAR